MRTLSTSLVLVLLTFGYSAPAASAEWLVTPYGGFNWGATATFNDVIGSYDEQYSPWIDFGGSLTWPRGVLGFEFDFGYHPQLLDKATEDDGFEWDSRVMTFMGNVNFSPGFLHVGKIGGFATGGIGMINVHAVDSLFPEISVDTNLIGVNGGGGVTIPFTSRFQLRADVRYFRSLQGKQPASEVDTTVGKLYFWRSSVGLTFHVF